MWTFVLLFVLFILVTLTRLRHKKLTANLEKLYNNISIKYGHFKTYEDSVLVESGWRTIQLFAMHQSPSGMVPLGMAPIGMAPLGTRA